MVRLTHLKWGKGTDHRFHAVDQFTTTFSWALVRAWLLFAAVLWYLGISPVSALLAVAIWIAQGMTGAWIIGQISARVNRGHDLLFVLGPGAVLGIGATVGTFLLLRGGTVGTTLTLGLLMVGSIAWLRVQPRAQVGSDCCDTTPVALLAGCALVANAGEFSNLLLPGVALLALGVVWAYRPAWSYRIVVAAVALALLITSAAKRSMYWWWASDDTTMLAAIGTIVVKRGRIADTAGWSTESYHWFLHAWLALWSRLSDGYIFETYQVAWPFVAAVSVFASFWLTLSILLGAEFSPVQLLLLGLAGAGLVRLEWTAPQEQQPFLFAMVTVGAWWLNTRRTQNQRSKTRAIIGLFVMAVAIPAVLYLAKPSLIAAWGLLVAGVAIEAARRRYRLSFFACAVLAMAVVVAGVSAMRIGSTWVSGRYITTFGISYPSPDLGWCERGSFALTVTCLFSLRATLMVAFIVSIVVLCLQRFSSHTRTLVVLMLPLVLAYLPFRLLVSSGVGSGAPSFYRLPEMAMMMVILLALAVLLSTKRITASVMALLSAVTFVAVQLSVRWELPSDLLGPVLLQFVVTQYLSSLDVAILMFAVVGAACVAVVVSRSERLIAIAAATCCVVSLVPIANLVSEPAEPEESVLRMSRPEFLGPADIEDVSTWLRNHTANDAVLATNYLCDEDRIDECRRSSPSTMCAFREPVLTASWVLPALSKRDFLYLSQGWDVRPRSFILHEISTRLSNEISRPAIEALVARGVSFFVASRAHSNQDSWRVFVANASFTSKNFAVVDLEALRERSVK